MGRYVGIDYGSNMIKAAGTSEPDESPRVLPLAADDPFFPAAVQLTSAGQETSAGWAAFKAQDRNQGDCTISHVPKSTCSR